MPLFGKKKDSKGNVSASGGGYPKQQPYPTQQQAYPTQQPAYPTQQPAYPTQQPAYPTQQPAYPQQSQFGGPPPPYQPQQTVVQPPQTVVQPYPGGQPPVAQQQASGSGVNNEDLAYLALASPYYYGYGGGLVAAAALGGLAGGHRGSAPVCSVPQPQTPPGQPAQGVFDQGARFDPNKPVNVPPPPPGVAPTSAQVAAAHGQTVTMSQERKDSWGFGSDGGATFF